MAFATLERKERERDIALIGYRNELQHEQHKSISTISLRISAARDFPIRKSMLSCARRSSLAIRRGTMPLFRLQTGIRLKKMRSFIVL
jgi:hypothetical protein